MNISSNLKRLRRERDLTQEKLAAILGVVPQAVSKWERGEGLPDITLVPSIAAALNVTTDALFGMDAERKKQRVKEVLAEWGRVQAIPEGIFDHAAGAAYLREQLRELPGEYELWFWLAFDLAFTDDEKNQREAIDILERIAEECTDWKIRETALPMIISIYASFIGDFNKAKEYAGLLIHKQGSYEYTAPAFLTGQELRTFLETEAASTVFYLNQLATMAANPINRHGKKDGTHLGSLEERLDWMELGTKAYELIKDKPWGGMWAQRCFSNCYDVAADMMLSELEDADRALDWLDRAAAYCMPAPGEKPSNIRPAEGYVGETEGLIPTENARKVFLMVLEQAAAYGGADSLPNLLRDHPRYKALVKKLEEAAH